MVLCVIVLLLVCRPDQPEVCGSELSIFSFFFIYSLLNIQVNLKHCFHTFLYVEVSTQAITLSVGALYK